LASTNDPGTRAENEVGSRTILDVDISFREPVNAIQLVRLGESGETFRAYSLIDLIAELKMIRSMQVRVNSRTITYGQQYQGEQAADSDIQKELAQLGQRQLKIFEVTNNIARGRNK